METYTKEEEIGGIKKYKTYTNVSNLHNWEENPREIKTELFDFLVTSLSEEGQLMPMLIDVRPEKMGTVLGGNMTYRAWTQRLNNTEVWIEPVLPNDDNHAVALALKHNANYGNYIELKLQEMAQKLKDAGYDLKEIPIPSAPEINLAELLQRVSPNTTEDIAPDVDTKNTPISQLGQVYQLGKHKLMCGDALNIEDLQQLLGDSTAGLLITDPPYNVNLDYNLHQDNMSDEQYIQFNKDWFNAASQLTENQIVFIGNVNTNMWIKNMDPYYMAIWSKGEGASSFSNKISLYTAWEPIFFHGKFNNQRHTDVFNFIAGGESGLDHPCPKPISLIAELIRIYKPTNNIIIDVFGGSGSTLIACEQTDSVCYMMELDTKYCDVIRKRYAKFIGKEEAWQTETPQIQQ